MWKLVVERPLSLSEVVGIADEVPAVTPGDAEVRGLELMRVDTSRNRTVIFAAGSAESIASFAELAMKPARGPAAKYTEARHEDLESRSLLEG
jgi:hypothetical protein